MITDRLVAFGGPKLLLLIVVLAALLGLSLTVNVLQVRGKAEAIGEVKAELARVIATAGADRKTCEATNRSANAAVDLLEGELQACRGQEQKIIEQRDLAMRQRSRAQKAAEGEAYMRRETVEAIARNYEDCRRPICRALSDELLNTPARSPGQ